MWQTNAVINLFGENNKIFRFIIVQLISLLLKFYIWIAFKASKCDAIIVNVVNIVQNDVNDDDFEAVDAILNGFYAIRHDIIERYHVSSSKTGMKALGCYVILDKTLLLSSSI